MTVAAPARVLVGEICSLAAALGEASGVAYGWVSLTGRDGPHTEQVAVLAVDGVWGLYYRRCPDSGPVTLDRAPLRVCAEFLADAQTFAERYIDRVGDAAVATDPWRLDQVAPLGVNAAAWLRSELTRHRDVPSFRAVVHPTEPDRMDQPKNLPEPVPHAEVNYAVVALDRAMGALGAKYGVPMYRWLEPPPDPRGPARSAADDVDFEQVVEFQGRDFFVSVEPVTAQRWELRYQLRDADGDLVGEAAGVCDAPLDVKIAVLAAAPELLASYLAAVARVRAQALAAVDVARSAIAAHVAATMEAT